MQESMEGEKRQLSRRTIVKGAAWSVPVIAAGVATPLAAASTCTEPAVTLGIGSWMVNGPKDTAAGYLGWRPNATAGSRRYYYTEGSTLDFSWVWTAASDATGALPVGTQIRIGIGGDATLDSYWIASFPVPTASTPSIQYTGATGPFGNYYIFEVVAPIPAGSVITWTSTITLRDTFPTSENIAGNFGAYARVQPLSDSTACPPFSVPPHVAAEWSTAASTSSLATYVLASQASRVPGFLNP